MGRRAQGVGFRPRAGVWYARFRLRGKQIEISTGVPVAPGAERPSEAAVREGEQIYAAALQGRVAARQRAPGASVDLAQAFADWLDAAPLRPDTARQYEAYTVAWLRQWRRSGELTDAALAAYFRGRLREVVRKSVLNEASALRSFATWAVSTGLLDAPLPVPKLPPAALGKAAPVRRRTRAPDLSADELEAILDLLPEWSDSRRRHERYPVRARFEVAWDTTLRPGTLDRLSVPEHWAPGEMVVRVDAEADKEGLAREVPLTPRAAAAFARVAPDRGLIFGRHKYHRFLGPAAAAVLPPAKARIFTGQHVRSAAITRALEASANLAGVMHLAGHRHASTTSKYVRPTLRAAEAVLRALPTPAHKSARRA